MAPLNTFQRHWSIIYPNGRKAILRSAIFIKAFTSDSKKVKSIKNEINVAIRISKFVKVETVFFSKTARRTLWQNAISRSFQQCFLRVFGSFSVGGSRVLLFLTLVTSHNKNNIWVLIEAKIVIFCFKSTQDVSERDELIFFSSTSFPLVSFSESR